MITCANRAGLEVLDTVFEGIASAEAVLSADERELGVCLADIGASTTELAVFFEGGDCAYGGVADWGGSLYERSCSGVAGDGGEAEYLSGRLGIAW